MNPDDPQTPPPSYTPPPNYPPPPQGPPPAYGAPPQGVPNYAPPQGAPPNYAYAPPPVAPVAGSSGIPQGGAILIAYLLGWIGALVMLAIEKNNQFVRFNALQSFILSIGATVVFVGLGFFDFYLPFGVALAFGCVRSLIGLAYVVGIIVVAIQAANGKMIRLPVVAEQADRLMPTFLR